MSDEALALDDECFFIAPIGKEGSPERNRSDGILDFIVSRAAQELNLTAVRADQIGEPGQITLQVITHVLGAKAAVADLTGLNPNVFYELAVRHTARLPVALIAEKDCKLPFDIAQMRTIFFDHTDLRSADQCRGDIVTQLHEALNGAVDSPITTSVDVRTLQGGSAVERNVAELVTTMEQITSSQRQDRLLLRRIWHNMDRLSGPGTRTERAALRSAILNVTHVQKLVASRGDEELLEALSALAEPLEYLARRSEFDVTSEILERPRRLPARDTEPPSEKAEDQSEAEPGEVISESAD